MAIKIILTNKSQVTSKQSEHGTAISTVDRILLSRALYQRLGSLTLCRTISEDYNEGRLPGEFVDYLDASNDINSNQNFPLLPQIYVDSGWTLGDEYLGELGVSRDYAYSKDTVNIPLWMDTSGSQTEYRVITDESDNTYLTTSNPLEVLVAYTGVNNG